MKPLTSPHLDALQILRMGGAFLLGVVLVAYILFQARNLINGPVILLGDSELGVVQHERMITIAGTAKNTTELTLNGRQVFTDESGVFAHTLVLENGYTIMTMRAEDRFGRITVLTRTFVYQPTS